MIPISEALIDQNLLGAALGDPLSWSNWIAILKAAYGEELTSEEGATFKKASKREKTPQGAFRELVAICGRRAGKSRIAAAISVYEAVFRDHSGKLAAGETGYVLALAPTISQSRLIFRYCLGFLEESPILTQKIQSTTQNEIRLQGNICIAVHPANFKSVRGRALLAVVFDESSFWRDENSSQADVEVYRSILPALSATGGMMVMISSPYRKIGLLYSKYRECFGKEDAHTLVIQAPSLAFNPLLDPKMIERAREADPTAAMSEWDGEFRNDLSSYLSEDIIEHCIDYDRRQELHPQERIQYYAFADASAGRGDAFTLCIGHKDGDRFVVDALRGKAGRFDPETVASEYVALLKEYRCRIVHGDAFAGEWVAAAFRKHGVEYRKTKANKSELYLEALPSFMRGAISIPNHQKLIGELRLLERKSRSSGKDIIDHPLKQHDDYANALVGCVYAASIKIPKQQLAAVAPKFHRASNIRRHNLRSDQSLRTFGDGS